MRAKFAHERHWSLVLVIRALPYVPQNHGGNAQILPVEGSSEKRLTGNGGKLNTSQAEPVAANSWAVGQFLSISCELLSY